MSEKPLPYLNPDLFKVPETMDEQMARARDAGTNAVNEIMERLCDEFVDQKHRMEVVQDIVLFTMFLGSIKTVEVSEAPMERRQLLSALHFLLKRGEREVPAQILAFAKEVLNEGPPA